MNDNIELDYGNADGIFKRAMAYQKVLAHQTSILSEKEYQKFILERLEKDNDLMTVQSFNDGRISCMVYFNDKR